MGDHDIFRFDDSNEVIHGGQKIIIHENYSTRDYTNDIGKCLRRGTFLQMHILYITELSITGFHKFNLL